MHFLTQNVEIRLNHQKSTTCSSRIYKATFRPTSGTVEIHYSFDPFYHGYDPKAFLNDGSYVATFCLPSEKKILRDVFNSEPYLTWKSTQLTAYQQRILNEDTS